MASEEEKYRAETFRIIGIAMLTPVGPLFLTPGILLKQLETNGFMLYLFITIISSILGAMILELGRSFLDKRDLKRWE